MTEAQRRDGSFDPRGASGAAVALETTEISGPEAGGAAPALLAHGLFGQGRNLGALGRALAPGRRVVLADMRNHGASPWSAATGYAAMGADLLAAAEASFGAAPALLIGHSMGGKAAMAAALAAPERVAALIVADIAPIGYAPTAAGHPENIAAMAEADLSGAPTRDAVGDQLASRVPDPGVRAFLLQNLVFETNQDGRRAPRWRLNLAALAEGIDDLTSWPAVFEGRRFEGPTLMVRGGASDYVTAEGQAAAARLFPDLEIATVDGAGHWLHAEKPAEFNAAVAAWLARRGL